MRFNFLLVLLLWIASGFTNAEKAEHINDQTLFHIARNRDLNTIEYTLNTDQSGMLNAASPIQIHWHKSGLTVPDEPLTWLQNQYAYGLKYLTIRRDYAKFQFVSYPKRSFELIRCKSGKFKVLSRNGAGLGELRRIFVRIDGGSFRFPKIGRVELQLKDTATNAIQTEIIIP
jgi:Domain of unknown function (DUF4833)